MSKKEVVDTDIQVFTYIGNSRAEVLRVGQVTGFGGQIQIPGQLVGIWKESGGPTVIPIDKFNELEGDQKRCLEYLAQVRAGGTD